MKRSLSLCATSCSSVPLGGDDTVNAVATCRRRRAAPGDTIVLQPARLHGSYQLQQGRDDLHHHPLVRGRSSLRRRHQHRPGSAPLLAKLRRRRGPQLRPAGDRFGACSYWKSIRDRRRAQRQPGQLGGGGSARPASAQCASFLDRCYLHGDAASVSGAASRSQRDTQIVNRTSPISRGEPGHAGDRRMNGRPLPDREKIPRGCGRHICSAVAIRAPEPESGQYRDPPQPDTSRAHGCQAWTVKPDRVQTHQRPRRRQYIENNWSAGRRVRRLSRAQQDAPRVATVRTSPSEQRHPARRCGNHIFARQHRARNRPWRFVAQQPGVHVSTKYGATGPPPGCSRCRRGARDSAHPTPSTTTRCGFSFTPAAPDTNPGFVPRPT